MSTRIHALPVRHSTAMQVDPPPHDGSCFLEGGVSGRGGGRKCSHDVGALGERNTSLLSCLTRVRSVRKRGPTASQVGSGPRESRVLELGKLV